jgi:hypothetical protein
MKMNVIIPMAKQPSEHQEDLGRCGSDRHNRRRGKEIKMLS